MMSPAKRARKVGGAGSEAGPRPGDLARERSWRQKTRGKRTIFSKNRALLGIVEIVFFHLVLGILLLFCDQNFSTSRPAIELKNPLRIRFKIGGGEMVARTHVVHCTCIGCLVG